MAVEVEYQLPGPLLVSSLMEAIAHASLMRPKEIDAALKIQSAYRMWRHRRVYRTVRNAVVHMQRIYRGHMQREYVKELRKRAELSFERAVYDYYATCIQACFRGYRVRRSVDDFYARRRYIQMTVDASSKVREMAAQMMEERSQSMMEKHQRQQEQLYKRATAKLNHMTSTASVSGIYRRPMELTSTQTVYGTNVENDIRRNARELRRPQHVRNVREALKAAAMEARKDATAPMILGHAPGKSSSEGQETADGKADKKDVLHFAVLRGAWNRSHVEGCSLPPIKDSSTENGFHTTPKVVSHACIEDYVPLYDTETAELARRVGRKEIQALHDNKLFSVSKSVRK